MFMRCGVSGGHLGIGTTELPYMLAYVTVHIWSTDRARRSHHRADDDRRVNISLSSFSFLCSPQSTSQHEASSCFNASSASARFTRPGMVLFCLYEKLT